jgi:uncharacterized protein (TIGR03435 family)
MTEPTSIVEPKSATRKFRSKLSLVVLLCIAVGGALVSGARTAPLSAQSAATSAQTANSPAVPQWQIDAGGKMAFDVASVKQDTAEPGPQTTSTNVPLGAGDAYKPAGGFFSAKNMPLLAYLIFAYKLSSSQINSMMASLPKWTNTTRYDIEAHAPAGMTPTKDQLRLMMQALLADRFKLAFHEESKQLPVLALVLDKPGKLGPKIQLHAADEPCSTVPVSLGSPIPATTDAGFPKTCGVFINWFDGGRIHNGGRNIDLQVMADRLTDPAYGIDRPVLNRTGLTGKYDMVLDFTPMLTGPLPPGAPQLDENGPTFQEALKDKLGMKLEPQTGPVDVIVIDHVEQPSTN